VSGHSRRHFLKRAAILGGGLALAPFGCSEKLPDKPQGPVQMCIARWNGSLGPDAGELKAAATTLTEQAIANLGGMKRFVKRGDVVWIKPNIGFRIGPEFAANTNPDVVATLVRLCMDAGAKRVRVGDNSCYGADGAYPMSGIEAAVEAVGGEVVYLDESRFKDMDIHGERLDKWPVHADIIESDLVINVPIAKQHALTAVTLCFKNYMGVVGGPREVWHDDMPACLTDIAAYMKPQLCVLDAVRVLTRNGPKGGDLADVKNVGTVAAGTDIVALEAFGAEMLGCDPARGKTMAAAERRGLGHRDYRSLVLRELGVTG